MPSYLEAEIAATCNALGCFDANGEYQADVQVIESVKDLIRFLRRDDATHEIRRILGQCNIVKTDLLPMLKKYHDHIELFDVVIRLLGNLTSPALLLFNEELPTDTVNRNYYLQLVGYLQTYKQAFTNSGIWAVLSSRLGKLFDKEWQERSEEDGIIIERILTLVRNVLQVPPDPNAEKRPDNDANLHDQILWALHQSGIVDIFLYIATSENEQAYYLHILEITSLMLREQSIEALASSVTSRSITEKVKDEAELLLVRQKENTERQKKLKRYTGARHSRFGGTYVIQNMKSISNSDIIYHKPLNQLSKLDFDKDKSSTKKAKNKLPMQDEQVERRSIFSVRLFLKEFCVEFLNGAYNTLMYNVKDRLNRAKSQTNDDIFFLWAMRFFMEFNRHYKFQVKLVSETMSVSTFHFVQKQIDTYSETLVMDKKKYFVWSRKLHLALRAYRELFQTLIEMDKSPSEVVRNSSKVIKSNIFYVPEYTETILHLMTSYDELKLSPGYLKDLIETQHIFMKLLHAFSKKDQIVVQKVVKIRKKKKKQTQEPSQPVQSKEDLWDEIGPQLSTVIQNDAAIPTDIAPFDAASETPIDEQKAEAMCKIQRLLHQREYEQAIGLLRSAREVWPENNSFGHAEMEKDEEYSSLKDIFFATIQDESIFQPQPTQVESSEESDNEEEGGVQFREDTFDFESFLNRFARCSVVEACGLALRNFRKNSEFTNHCVIKLLHRIAVDCKMPSMIFQASIFRTFQQILNCGSTYKELAKFAVFIIRKFAETAEKNEHVFLQLLFWSNPRDCFELEHGVGTYKEKSKAAKQAWSEVEEEELIRLSDEYHREQICMDMTEWIMSKLINQERTNRAVKKKLKDMGLLAGKPSLKRTWDNEDEEELRDLYEKLKDSNDILEAIVNRISTDRSKQNISKKLIEMGIVTDRSELRKKKSSGKQRSDSSDESDNSDDTNSHQRKPQTKKKKTISQRAKPTANKNDSIKLLLKIVDTDLKEVLNWLHESLSDIADDQENDAEDVGVPLVPITSEESDAMENDEFQKLLRSFGFTEPDNEQEAYWRIPGHFTPVQIRNMCTLITEALENRLSLPVETVERVEESSDEDVFSKVKKFMGGYEDKENNADTSNVDIKQPNKVKKKKKNKNSDMMEDNISTQENSFTQNLLAESNKFIRENDPILETKSGNLDSDLEENTTQKTNKSKRTFKSRLLSDSENSDAESPSTKLSISQRSEESSQSYSQSQSATQRSKASTSRSHQSQSNRSTVLSNSDSSDNESRSNTQSSKTRSPYSTQTSKLSSQRSKASTSRSQQPQSNSDSSDNDSRSNTQRSKTRSEYSTQSSKFRSQRSEINKSRILSDSDASDTETRSEKTRRLLPDSVISDSEIKTQDSVVSHNSQKSETPKVSQRTDSDSESSVTATVKKKSRIIVNDDSDDDLTHSASKLDQDSAFDQLLGSSELGRSNKNVLSDTDSEIGDNDLTEKRGRDMGDSDTEVPKTKRPKLIVSDDDD